MVARQVTADAIRAAQAKELVAAKFRKIPEGGSDAPETTGEGGIAVDKKLEAARQASVDLTNRAEALMREKNPNAGQVEALRDELGKAETTLANALKLGLEARRVAEEKERVLLEIELGIKLSRSALDKKLKAISSGSDQPQAGA